MLIALNRPGRKNRVLTDPRVCSPSELKMRIACFKCAPKGIAPIPTASERVGTRGPCREIPQNTRSSTNAGKVRVPTHRPRRANDCLQHSIKVATAENSCARASSALWPERHAHTRNRSSLASDCFRQERSRREPPCFAERPFWGKIMVPARRAHRSNTADGTAR